MMDYKKMLNQAQRLFSYGIIIFGILTTIYMASSLGPQPGTSSSFIFNNYTVTSDQQVAGYRAVTWEYTYTLNKIPVNGFGNALYDPATSDKNVQADILNQSITKVANLLSAPLPTKTAQGGLFGSTTNSTKNVTYTTDNTTGIIP